MKKKIKKNSKPTMLIKLLLCPKTTRPRLQPAIFGLISKELSFQSTRTGFGNALSKQNRTILSKHNNRFWFLGLIYKTLKTVVTKFVTHHDYFMWNSIFLGCYLLHLFLTKMRWQSVSCVAHSDPM